MNEVKNFIKILSNNLRKIYAKHIQMKAIRNRIRNASFKVPKLSNYQKRELEEYYNEFGIDVDDLFHRWYYAVTGEFSPRFIPNWLFQNEINPVLNNTSLAGAWADKNYYEIRLPEVIFPEAIVRNIAGYYYDRQYRMISKADAIKLLELEGKFVIKPSLSGGGGSGIQFITDIDKIPEIFDSYKENYIIQKRFLQHPKLAHLNPSSVNIVRIISLLLDGCVYIISASLRVGAPGSFTDNYIDDKGGGMLTIGIDESGKLKDVAFFANGDKTYRCLNNSEFSGMAIPAYSKMIDTVKKNHIKLPYFKMISWDITSDIFENPVVMEYNLKSQGTVYYQYVNGPLFGEYTEKILDMVKNEK